MEILKTKFNRMSKMKNPEQAKIWFQRIFGDYFIGRKCRSQWLLRELSFISSDKTLRLKKCLDAGCDDGTITVLLAKKYPKWQITGIDKNEEAIRAAKYRRCLHHTKNARFVQADLFRLDGLSFCKGNFDLLISLDVLEHVEDDIVLLKEFNRLLRSEGILILHVPAKNQWHFLKRPYLRSHHSDHVRTGYSQEEIINKLKRTGFKTCSITRTFRKGTTLVWDINNYLAVHRKRTSLFFFLQLLLVPLLCFLVRFDLLYSDQPGNGIIIKAIKVRKDIIHYGLFG